MYKSLFFLGLIVASALATDFYTYTYFAGQSCSGNTAAGFEPVDECSDYSKSTCDNTGVTQTVYSDDKCQTSVQSVSYKLGDCTDYNFKVSGCGLSFDDSMKSANGIWIISYQNSDCSGNVVRGFGLAPDACWSYGDSTYFKMTVDGNTITQHNCTDSACNTCSGTDSKTVGTCLGDGMQIYYNDAMTVSASILVIVLAALLLLH